MLKKIKLLILPLFIAFSGCRENCDLSLHVGEMVQIPIEFIGFNTHELRYIKILRKDRNDPIKVDSFDLSYFAWGHEIKSNSVTITDNPPDSLLTYYGYYKSYFDNCDLIFIWENGKDTLSDFKIKLSKKNVMGCHKNDPNVKIDEFSFVHKNKIISRNENIKIIK